MQDLHLIKIECLPISEARLTRRAMKMLKKIRDPNDTLDLVGYQLMCEISKAKLTFFVYLSI